MVTRKSVSGLTKVELSRMLIIDQAIGSNVLKSINFGQRTINSLWLFYFNEMQVRIHDTIETSRTLGLAVTMPLYHTKIQNQFSGKKAIST